ncbi:MAG TPA: asparagine synthase-related protein [Lacunisphaera sp.]|jgi:asparagine synthetase B (glutamine-hydrolysing)|nr:asparagine synthase-related protein [Lacunisphaera sp.]
MFLFCPIASLLPTSISKRGLDAWGTPRLRRWQGGAILWIDDGFTRCVIDGHSLRVVRSPNKTSLPVCGFRWHPAKQTIELFRRWSGEFHIYFRLDSTPVIASDKKLFNFLNGKNSGGLIPQKLVAGSTTKVRLSGQRWTKIVTRDRPPPALGRRPTIKGTATQVRQLLQGWVRQATPDTLLLLSGGIDSSAVAAAAHQCRIQLAAATFAVRGWTASGGRWQEDMANARRVATHLKLRHYEIPLDPRALVRNLPLAIFLSETHRGTIIEEAVALIEVAKFAARRNFRRVWFCDAADDLFGSFHFVLRLYCGRELQGYFRDQLTRALPDELAIVQNNFAPWRITVEDPYWTEPFFRLGYHLPTRLRVDRRRLMKPVLRAAFRGELPDDIVERPKCVTRDATGVRSVMEQAFGKERERFRETYNTLIKDDSFARLTRALGKLQ